MNINDNISVDNMIGRQFGHLVVLSLSYVSKRNTTYWTCQCKCGNCIELSTIELISGHRTTCGCKREFNDIIGQKRNKLTAISLAYIKNHTQYWLFKCDCGNTKIISRSQFLTDCTKSCGCLRKIPDITGQKFGKLTAISHHHNDNKGHANIWLFRCDCGIEKLLSASQVRYGKIRSCGCMLNRVGKENPLFGGYNELSGNLFCSIKKGAKTRGIPFEITIQQLWDIYIKQNRKCALSGLDIVIDTTRKNNTASVDRIDSSQGYFLDNVQWVHKDVNIAKNDMSQEKFVTMCRLVTEHQNAIKNVHTGQG